MRKKDKKKLQEEKDLMILASEETTDFRGISKEIGFSYSKVIQLKNINKYDTIIYVGSIYASNSLGLRKTFKKLNNINNKNIYIITVGMSETNNRNIDERIKSIIKKDIYDKVNVFHLNGKINYFTLNKKDKFLISLMYKILSKENNNELKKENQMILEIYKNKIDKMDFNKLIPVIDLINNEKK